MGAIVLMPPHRRFGFSATAVAVFHNRRTALILRLSMIVEFSQDIDIQIPRVTGMQLKNEFVNRF